MTLTPSVRQSRCSNVLIRVHLPADQGLFYATETKRTSGGLAPNGRCPAAGATREPGVNLGENGECDRFRRDRADIDADGAAQSVAQTLGRGAQLLRNS